MVIRSVNENSEYDTNLIVAKYSGAASGDRILAVKNSFIFMPEY